ncbi:MAG: guanylate kinase, partial [Bacteroidetes bacterium]|nr:guanylate kinase [Bacteroidota bacterium]
SKEEFEQNIREGSFLEYEEVYPGLFYGTLKSEIERLWASGKAVLFDIDVMGGLTIKKTYPEKTLTVFVKPPSVEALEQRLRNRNTDSEETLQVRLAKSASELEKASAFDEILINDQLEEALRLAEALVIHFLK